MQRWLCKHSFQYPFHFIVYILHEKAYRIPVQGRRAAIIGKSALVGQPCFHLLQRQGCFCDQCDIHTIDIPSITQKADLIVSAVGKPGLIQGSWVRPNASLIDIGTRCVQDCYGKCMVLGIWSLVDNLAGDVNLESCIGRAGCITPVPGGVALLTTAMLMYNTLKSFVYQEGLLDAFNAISENPLRIDSHFVYKSFMWFDCFVIYIVYLFYHLHNLFILSFICFFYHSITDYSNDRSQFWKTQSYFRHMGRTLF